MSDMSALPAYQQHESFIVMSEKQQYLDCVVSAIDDWILQVGVSSTHPLGRLMDKLADDRRIIDIIAPPVAEGTKS